jgi:hypothetical protein
MAGKQPKSLSSERVRSDLKALADDGLWDVSQGSVGYLSRLSTFCGSDAAPAFLVAFRAAFRDFLKTNEALSGAPSEMAIRLFGVQAPYREQTAVGRTTEIGKVVWKGREVQYDAARRAKGRRDEVLDLVTAAIMATENAVSSAATADAVATQPTRADPPAPIARRLVTRYRWPAALGGGLALCALILAVTLPGNDEGQVHTSTVNIGRAFAQPPKRSRSPVETGEELAGITLEACTATAGCGAPSARPTAAQRPGDLVSFRLDLNDSYQEPIATMSLTASTATHNGFTDVTVVAEWRPPLATSAIESRTAAARVALQPATPAGLPRLDYVPGTTKLYTLVDTPVAEEVPALNLPDGLFASSGITLEQVGPRRQHPVVRFADVGNIHFDMRVAIAKP